MEAPWLFPGEEPRLRALLDGYLSSLAESLKAQPFAGGVRALVLAGGYGRGEGGIFRGAETAEPQLYNDLEFYCVLAARSTGCSRSSNGARSRRTVGMKCWGSRWNSRCCRESAVHGRASRRCFSTICCRRTASCMVRPRFWRRCPAPLRERALIPAHEAARLLFNRGSGLFYSSVALTGRGRAGDERVRGAQPRQGLARPRRRRAGAERRISFFLRGAPPPSSAEPLALTPPDWPLLVEWHAEGVEFKLHPRHRQPGLAALRERQEALAEVWMRTFLWLEAHRLEASFPERRVLRPLIPAGFSRIPPLREIWPCICATA